MYLIGINDFEFIKVTYNKTMYDGKSIWTEIRNLEYGTPMHEATIVPDYEIAEELLKEIQNNVEKIRWTSSSIIGEIFDRENGFDSKEYVSKLKVYELIPIPIEGD